MRVLLVSEAVSLAHVARPAVIAKALAAAGFEDLHFAVATPEAAPLQSLPCRFHRLDSISSADFLGRAESGRHPYGDQELRRYLASDLEVLDKVKPDLIIGDFRLTLPLSCSLRGVRLATITNAYWSPYSAATSCRAPDLPIMRWIGDAPIDYIFRAFFPLFDQHFAAPFNRLYQAHGQKGLSGFRALVTAGDHVWFADPPELVKVRELLPHHEYLGALFWTPESGEIPPEICSNAPVIYASVGSSGSSQLLAKVLSALDLLDLPSIVATAGREFQPPLSPRVHCQAWVRTEDLPQTIRLAITNGGSPSTYPWLAAGVPVLALPANSDQMLLSEHLCQSGAVHALRGLTSSAEDIAAAAAEMLDDRAFLKQASSISPQVRRLDAQLKVVALVKEIANGRTNS